MAEHRYGGPWTELKLEAVEYYLQCYTKALTRRPFDLWYIDAFAGTGSRTAEKVTGGLFAGQPISVTTEVLAGSARRALNVEPPFHHFIFIEKDTRRCNALRSLKTEYPNKDIQLLQGDANQELRKLVTRQPWLRKDKGPGRGVVFLDPYSLQVEWATLRSLADTHVFDVWYLFPIRDIVRQLAHDFSGIGPKEPKLDLVLGPEWRELYKVPSNTEPRQLSFLGEQQEQLMRDATWREVEDWVRRRLQSTFCYTSEPLPLISAPGRQIFSLFLAVSNPSKPAVDLAKHFVKHVIRKYGQEASR